MLCLILRIAFNTAFTQLLKAAQARDGHLLPAAAVNYIVAALMGAIGMWVVHAPAPQGLSVALGIATGVVYALSLLGIDVAVRTSGVSIAVAVVQLSVLVPTVVAMAVYRERPGAVQAVGMALALPALWLLARGQTVETETPRVGGLRGALPLLGLFCITGLSGVLMQVFETSCPAADRLAYAVALFAVSAVFIVGVALRRRVPWGPSAVPLGTLVGMCNLGQLVATLLALGALPAIVVFPVSSALTVVVSALLSVWLWRERLTRAVALGMALAIASAALLNLK